MSVAQKLSDLKQDLTTLLHYSQKLREENDSLKNALEGSIIFFENEDKEKSYRSLSDSSIATPSLQTVHDWRRTHFATGKSSDVTRLHTVAATRNSTPLNDEVPAPPGSPTLSRSTEALPNVASSGGGSDSNATARPQLTREAPFNCGNESSGEYCEKDVNERSSNPVLLLMGDLMAILQKWSKLQNTVARLKSNAATSVPMGPNILEERLVDVRVTGCENAQNIHIFAIHTVWTNGQRFELYRKYEEIFTLQDALCSESPPTTQKLPKLPVADHVLALLGRLNTKAALQSRVKLVEELCKTGVLDMAEQMEEHTYRASVLAFFLPRPDDTELQSIHKQTGVSMMKPDSLPAGSQFVECEVTADYEAGSAAELTVTRGETVMLISTETTGWALVTKQGEGKVAGEEGNIGYVPSAFLREYEDQNVLENSEKLQEQYLGFLSSVALQKDTIWLETHSDLVDTPRPKAMTELSILEPDETDHAPRHRSRADLADTSRPKAMTDLSILKSSIHSHGRSPRGEGRRAIKKGHGKKSKGIQDHDQNGPSQDLSLSSRKELAIKSGNTDWGIRESSTSIPEDQEPEKNNTTDSATTRLPLTASHTV